MDFLLTGALLAGLGIYVTVRRARSLREAFLRSADHFNFWRR